jgi:hypothetical protein
LGELLPSLARRHERLEALLRGMVLLGLLRREEEADGTYTADPAALAAALERWGQALPLHLAVVLALEGRDEARPQAGRAGELTELVAAALQALAGRQMTVQGLRRCFGMAAARAELLLAPALLDALMEKLALLEVIAGDSGPCIIPGGYSPPSATPAPPVAATSAEGSAPRRPSIVADGAHLLRVLPEAGLEERRFALLVAKPQSLGLVWELELDRESLGRALAAGISGEEVISLLEGYGGRTLPQSLAFSVRSWAEEHRSMRLFHGWILVLEGRRRILLESRPELHELVAETLAEGVYLLAGRASGELRARFAAAGIELPPEVGASQGRGSMASGSLPHLPTGVEEAGPSPLAEALGGLLEELSLLEQGQAASGEQDGFGLPDPAPRIAELEAALGRMEPLLLAKGGPDLVKELADRVANRLVLDEEQLAHAEVAPVRVEATGLDYGGKARIAERALKTPGDRLEIRYQLSGSGPERALVRPVRLEKTEKGLVLEGEDLSTGGPIRVPLGAASSVRRLRATPFGDER